MITDTEARKIASSWHGGGGTALYALSSTGAINTARADHDVLKEIRTATCAHDYFPTDGMELINLVSYVETNGPRGPVDGWSTLTW